MAVRKSSGAGNGANIRLAADIGGTFTDVVLEHGGRRHSAKVLTTPRAPEQGMLEGISRVLKEAARRPADVARAPLAAAEGSRGGRRRLPHAIAYRTRSV